MIHVIDSHRPVNLRNLFEPAPYAHALFDARRRQGKGRDRHGMGADMLGEQELSVVVWADAEGDDSREAEKEAWEALQVSPGLYAGDRSPAPLLTLPRLSRMEHCSTSLIQNRIRTRIQARMMICRYEAVEEELVVHPATEMTRQMTMDQDQDQQMGGPNDEERLTR